LPPLFLWIAASATPGRWRTQRPLAHLTRGAIGVTSMFLSFGALTLLPLAEAVTLSFIAPLFAVALSALILAEPVGRHRWTAVAIGLIGVVVVMRPAGTDLSPLGLGLAVAGAFSVAAATITIRQIGRTESTQSIVLWFTLICTAAGAATLPVFGQLHDGTTWTLLVALGMFGGVGQLLMTASLRAAAVGAVVPFDYAHLIWAALLGWLIWETYPRSTTWAGAAIIIASGLYTIWREHKLGRDKPRPEPL
jgi:drug/metabolite transporter (DMT)-like permease